MNTYYLVTDGEAFAVKRIGPPRLWIFCGQTEYYSRLDSWIDVPHYAGWTDRDYAMKIIKRNENSEKTQANRLKALKERP